MTISYGHSLLMRARLFLESGIPEPYRFIDLLLVGLARISNAPGPQRVAAEALDICVDRDGEVKAGRAAKRAGEKCRLISVDERPIFRFDVLSHNESNLEY